MPAIKKLPAITHPWIPRTQELQAGPIEFSFCLGLTAYPALLLLPRVLIALGLCVLLQAKGNASTTQLLLIRFGFENHQTLNMLTLYEFPGAWNGPINIPCCPCPPQKNVNNVTRLECSRFDRNTQKTKPGC